MATTNRDTIQIGLLGLGTVGSGTYALLQQNASIIERKLGVRPVVRRVAVRDLAKRRAVTVPSGLLTSDPVEVLDDPAVEIVCELIGGVSPAREYILRALRSGKHVVTANKELIARDGHALMMEAQERGLDFLFEGSVGGGIPIIQPMKSALAGNQVQRIQGIVNGTTNYILTRMTQEGTDFADALRDAQAAGYAEADPTSDVEGFDAQYKIAILSSIAFTSQVHVSDVYVEGITHVTKRDIECARDLGYVIKLVAVAESREDGALQVRVTPMFLRAAHPLASTNDVFNAILLRGDAVGDVMFYGRGAGMMPTGSAVVGDIMDVCRNIIHGSTSRIGCTCFEQRQMLPVDQIEALYYLRMLVLDRPGVLASVAGVLGEHEVSIESVVQRSTGEGLAEIIWVTHRTREADIRAALARICTLECVVRLENWLRVDG
ncbi:MAG TPA: homoserine dehydrogenase [Chthonomonadales bacterium]|nr:homoserine dehydrogenase [Chthonomonadales bacterium]